MKACGVSLGPVIDLREGRYGVLERWEGERGRFSGFDNEVG